MIEIRYGSKMTVWYTCFIFLLVISFSRIAIEIAITVPSTMKARLYRIVFRVIVNASFVLKR